MERAINENYYKGYNTLRVSVRTGVAYVTIDNPPVNILNVRLMSEIRSLLKSMETDRSVKVIIFESANPDFFIAHVDMKLVDEPHAFDEIAKEVPEDLNVFQALAEMLRQQPQITIIKLAGIARGGGAEFVAAADMSFAAIGRAGLAQCEALMGIIPGGGATQYLTLKAGRARALEVILGAELFDAETAAQYRWVNRAIPAEETDAFVDNLARNIAALPDGVIAATKAAIPRQNLAEGLKRESDAWAGLIALPAAEKLIRGGLANGAQTREGELKLEDLLRRSITSL